MTARRLVLTQGEMAALVEFAEVTLPPGLVPQDAVPKAERQWSPEEEQALAVNLAVLARPVAAVRIETAVPSRVLRGLFSVAGSLGASLFTLAGETVELSLFNAADLGGELLRAVPEPGGGDPVRAGLGPERPLRGTVDLADLEWQPWMPPRDRGLAERARAQTRGSVSALITGRNADGSVLAGQVAWLLTGSRWTGLRPVPAGNERVDRVRLEPVDRADFPSWVAPHLTAVLEAGGRPVR
ncbi:hypothetical protein AMIS_58200 [Actinoplanes missouriensis 431]|uniref:ESX secretion-associated protein EspG n=1 Tax=Actinoplanes missouriensis (strain ATCC 14538 / DSM 43046 / CBS 188.64 / JCM 3121 / NBRC 102363 / NCIMB 12654 / NRRL B-3342 / UNCC 431) TaxID=512565 RepID=I0HDF3_ACTM4|nr:hypothetical protein [Actinoplanes missouriensis]BAL91040.1 hypothetical protein AMIS_58200 [Actinoplanes missouriensis 431]